MYVTPGMTDMQEEWARFEAHMAEEIGTVLANEFVSSLWHMFPDDPLALASAYFEVGKAWSSLISAWRDWVIRRAERQSYGIQLPVLVMRDAKPLSVLPNTPWPQAWLNRLNCGIPDELSGDLQITKNPDTERYMKETLLFDNPFTLVDSGCWGSLVLWLHKLGYKFQPLFFFSHNPAIPGFLNELGVDPKVGERLNDSLECAFPNSVRRPTRFYESRGRLVNRLEPLLEPTDSLSAILCHCALYGVRVGAMGAKKKQISALDAVSCLLESRTFVGLLPRNSPTWSQGAEFLASWPKDLVWR